MPTKKIVLLGSRILAVCTLFAVCFVIGGVASGVSRIAQQVSSGQPSPAGLLGPFLFSTFCVGIIVSYFIFRSYWHGWKLAGALFVAMYGISTVASQVESLFFLSSKFPHGMIGALFLQGVISNALFCPLAVRLLGKWRVISPDPVPTAQSHTSASALIREGLLLVLAFVFLYMFFGYYIAWKNPVLRQYYGGGPAYSSFLNALRGNITSNPWVFPLQVFRALLYIACMLPFAFMLRAGRF
jgi:hypothetical protein